MIKLYCDMCNKECSSLYSIHSKVEHQGVIRFGNFVDAEESLFNGLDSNAEESIRNKQVCRNCKSKLFENVLKYFDDRKENKDLV